MTTLKMNMNSSLQIVQMFGSYACIDLTMDACLCSVQKKMLK